jgi:diadenosine tetraphosphate (Ap4A) HIT family hydrolase
MGRGAGDNHAMPTLFTKIINGGLPGRFVWTDDRVVAFLTIAPITPGHTLVVPRREVDDWTAIEPDLQSHLMVVSGRIGAAVRRAFDAPRAGLVIAGFEVPHAHLHVFPAWGLEDFDFGRANSDVPAGELDDARDRIVAALA